MLEHKQDKVSRNEIGSQLTNFILGYCIRLIVGCYCDIDGICGEHNIFQKLTVYHIANIASYIYRLYS